MLTAEAICFSFPTKEETEGIADAGGPFHGNTSAGKRHSGVPGLAGKRSSGKEKDRKGFAKEIPEILEGKAPDLTKNGRKTAEERSLRVIGKTLAGLYESLYTGEREK